jgi:hypothetical protein
MPDAVVGATAEGAGDEGAVEVVGWVDGEPVPATELARYQATLAAAPVGARLGIAVPEAGARARNDVQRTDALRAWATRALLVERLADREAARLDVQGPGSPDEWVLRLEAAGELEFVGPSDEDAFACYQANAYRYQYPESRRTRHVLLADRASAEHVATTVAGPAGLAAIAHLVSLDAGTRASGGDLGWVRRGQLAGELETAIFQAVPRRTYGPVQSPFGWHVFAVEAVSAARARPFAECRLEVLAELSQDRRRAAWREWWDRRVAEAIQVPSGSEAVLLPGLPGTTHRH